MGEDCDYPLLIEGISLNAPSQFGEGWGGAPVATVSGLGSCFVNNYGFGHGISGMQRTGVDDAYCGLLILIRIEIFGHSVMILLPWL